jgi:hypothetical protein
MKLYSAAFAAIAVACLATPALADDKLTPAENKPPFDGFANRPWIKVLGYCGALYLERSDFLKATDAAAAQTMRQRAAPFLAATVTRLQHDRGLTSDEAFKVALNEISKGRMINQALMNGQIEDAFQKQDLRCKAVLKLADAVKD